MFGPNFWLHGQRNAAMFYWSHYTRAVRIKLKNTTDLFYRLGSILVTFLVIYLWFIYKVVEYISISPRDLQVQAGFVCGARSFSILNREWRGEENFSLLYRARLLLLSSRIWGFLHLLLESRFLSLSLTLFLSFCQKNCVLRVWRSVLWRCYQFRFFWPMVIFWQTILLRFYALLLFWNYDRIMMTEKTHK